MKWYDHYNAINSFMEGFVFWVQALPTWGMACVILILSGVSSKLGGLTAQIGCGIVVWNIFGASWGMLFLAGGAISILLVIIWSALD